MDKRLMLFSIYNDGDTYRLVENEDKEECWNALMRLHPGHIDIEMVFDTVSGDWLGLAVY